MKQLLFILVSVFMLTQAIYGQHMTIEGEQHSETKAPKLISNPISISENYKIINFSTDAPGFWIEKDNSIYKTFKKNNKGHFIPNPIGLILYPGTYKAYPNIAPTQKKTFVKLYIAPIEK